MTYQYNGVCYQRTAFASHPDRVIVIHLTANKAGALTGRVQLTDMHQVRIAAAGNQLSAAGRLENGFEYEAQLRVLNSNGSVAVVNDDACVKNPWNIAVPDTNLAFDQCDSVTLILGAGTNFLQDHTQQWLGAHPHAAVTQQVDSAAKQSVTELLARHVKDYQSLFRRFSLDVGTTAPDLLAKTTLARLEVDMSWDDGRLTQAVIHSKSGLPCRVVCGEQHLGIQHRRPGSPIPSRSHQRSILRSVR